MIGACNIATSPIAPSNNEMFVYSDEDVPLADFPLCDTLPLPEIISSIPSSNLKYSSFTTKPKAQYSKLKIKVSSSTGDSGTESSDNSDDDTR